ncbi:TPA: restriction endonuclease subunit S [Streptococcus suis]|nr:restriction endonuclease subunit S [Streptococcus suis]HEM5323323.1 restriction endonuclease subunit S [Streptococcus suis]HEP1830038.1 restriction endonuclease subunit S [Streptococcus suis]
MNHIEKMLQDYCPNGVEWKELGEVCVVNKGKQLNKTFLVDDGQYPAYNGGKTYSGRTDSYNVTENTVIISQGGASAGFVNFVTTKFWANAHCYYLLPDITRVNNRYLYHFLKMKQSYLMDFQHGAGIPALKSDKITKMLLPLPPLKIQEEIVQILDKFTEYVTELTAELTAELTLRQKQYNYFRDYLLNFDSDSSGGANNKVYQVEWKTLGDIAKLKNGKDWKSLSVGDVPVYGSGGAMGEFVSEYAYNKPTVLIPRKGSISNIFYLEKPFWNVDTIYYTEIDDSQVVPRYLYYYLTTIDLESMATNPTRPSLTQAILDKIPIPVPSLPIQQRIVQVLDNFDVVCNDLNIGLPKEIELRQKQYDYFREKLLTFTAEGVYTDSTVQYRQDLIRLLNWVFGPIRVELGAVATVQRGASPRPISSYLTEDEDAIPWIKIGDTLSNSKYITSTEQKISQAGAKKSRLLKKGDFILSNSMSYGRPYILQIDGAIHDGWASISDFEETINPDFLYQYLSSQRVQSYWDSKINSGSVSNLNSGIIKSLEINLPSLSTQKRIVAILDKFDELTNSISQGLPKEIELRQKQYEYWSNKLFNLIS